MLYTLNERYSDFKYIKFNLLLIRSLLDMFVADIPLKDH